MCAMEEKDEFDKINRSNTVCGWVALIGTFLAFVIAFLVVFGAP